MFQSRKISPAILIALEKSRARGAICLVNINAFSSENASLFRKLFLSRFSELQAEFLARNIISRVQTFLRLINCFRERGHDAEQEKKSATKADERIFTPEQRTNESIETWR